MIDMLRIFTTSDESIVAGIITGSDAIEEVQLEHPCSGTFGSTVCDTANGRSN